MATAADTCIGIKFVDDEKVAECFTPLRTGG